VSRQTSTGSWIGAVVVVLAVVVAGIYLARKAMQPQETAASVPTAPAPMDSLASVGSGMPIQHPIEQAQSVPAAASTAALPMLEESDANVTEALALLADGSELSSLLVSNQVITRIVTTIDALPRHHGLGSTTLPARTPKGAFAVDMVDGMAVAGAANDARYAPYMKVVDAVDPQSLVTWYAHAYPLFQQAYRQLGYPDGYFNDRLIVVIDDLLAAPEPEQPPALTQSDAFHVYADPALESLSAGQKLMLRVGHDNEVRIKTKLRAIRAALLGHDLREVPATPVTAG